MEFIPESPVQIGDVVQGYITNTGTIQRIELNNSQMRARLRADEQVFEDGTPVEAIVTTVGTRSVDVELPSELQTVPRRKEREQADGGNQIQR